MLSPCTARELRSSQQPVANWWFWKGPPATAPGAHECPQAQRVLGAAALDSEIREQQFEHSRGTSATKLPASDCAMPPEVLRIERTTEEIASECDCLRLHLLDSHDLVVTAVARGEPLAIDGYAPVRINDAGQIGQVRFQHVVMVASRPHCGGPVLAHYGSITGQSRAVMRLLGDVVIAPFHVKHRDCC